MKQTSTDALLFYSHPLFKIIVYAFLVVFGLSACTSLENQSAQISTINIDNRADFLRQQTHWSAKGKIAFISPEEKQSANFYWKQSPNKRELSLSTFLGVNVLHLESANEQHTLKVDGQKYQHDNLEELLESVSGLPLPVEAFQYWLKSIDYLPSDKFQIDPVTKLPSALSTSINGQQWQVSYDKYKTVNGVMLAHKIQATERDLTIKIAITKWQLLTASTT